MGKPVLISTETPIFGTFVSLGHLKRTSSINFEFLKAWMESDLFIHQVAQKVTGASQKNLNTGWLKEFKVPFPTLKAQQQFADFVAEVDKLRFVALPTH